MRADSLMDAIYHDLETRISAAISAADPAEFDDLALEIHRFQRSFDLPYDQYCRSLGAPDSPATWREIPAVPQAAFKHASLRVFPANAEVAAFRTSGTTGEGYGVHHFSSLRLYDEAILKGWDLAGLPSLPQVILTPPPAVAPYSSLSHMMGTLKSRAPGGEQHWCIMPDGALDIDQLDQRLRDSGQPVLLLGTALAFLHFFDAMKGDIFELPPGSVAFETGGYKGSGRALTKETLYEMFRRCLGLQARDVVNEYGMTELSSQFYTRGLGSPHVSPPWVRAMVVDPATNREVTDGGTGILRIYDLANLGSVLAIQTRDLAVRRGTGFELMGRDPTALPRGCSRSADERLSATS